MIRIQLLILLLFCFSCDTKVAESSKPETPPYELYFKNYMTKQFGLKIPDQGHYFVVVPSKGCLNCAKDEVKDFLALSENPKVTLVVARNVIQVLKLPLTNKQQNVKIDLENNLDRQNLPFPDFTGIYKTSNGKVVEIIPFNHKTYQSAFAKITGN